MVCRGSGKIVGVGSGTFTDLILLDPLSFEVRLSKVPSTIENQAFGALSALEQVAEDLAEIDLIVHGTTTTTNAVLERKLRRQTHHNSGLSRCIGARPSNAHIALRDDWKIQTMVSRELRLEVDERIDAEVASLHPKRE